MGIYYNSHLFSDSSNIENCFKDFIIVGKLERYYKSGKLYEKFIVDNENMYAKYESFYENGNLKEKGKVYQEYLDSEPKKIENFEYFYDNGKLRERGNYNYSGKKDGLFEYFSQNGKLIKKENYKDGELI